MNLLSFQRIILLLIIFGSCSINTINADPQVSSEKHHDWKIDHTVIVVSDLNRSIEEFRGAGYTVIPGGEFPDAKTHNALIPFADGSYIELFAAIDPSLAAQMKQLVDDGIFSDSMKDLDLMDQRFMLHLADGPGVRDFALSVPGLNLTTEPSLVSSSGLNLSSPISMSRTSDLGEVEWFVDVPLNDNQMSFPFLITDKTPRSYRVKEVDSAFHPNGATGIASVTVAVSDPSLILPMYTSLLTGGQENKTTETTTYLLNGSSISIIKNSDLKKKDGPANLELKKNDGGTLSMRGFSL